MLQLVGVPRQDFVPDTPTRLRKARTCYDHMAGEVAVALHDSMMANRWLKPDPLDATTYHLNEAGVNALENMGLDVTSARKTRRRA